MKIKVLGILLMLSTILGSCFKEVECGYRDQQYVASSSEIDYMQSFFTSNNITDLTQHPSGVFYKISNAGTGANPDLCSAMLVNYSAYRFGYGNAFDSYLDDTGISFVLGTLITGVQKVMPQVKTGGSIVMYIPPSLAYGNNEQRDQLGNIILPANSYIKFEMSLKAVQ